jgi:hypothetical protein
MLWVFACDTARNTLCHFYYGARACLFSFFSEKHGLLKVVGFMQREDAQNTLCDEVRLKHHRAWRLAVSVQRRA